MRLSRSLTLLCLSILLLALSAAGCNRRGQLGPNGNANQNTNQANLDHNRGAQPNNSGAAKAGQGQAALPAPTGFVNDYAHVLDDESKARLETLLNRLQKQAMIDFAVVTVETTGGLSASDYSLNLARQWGVSSKQGGLLLFLAIKDRAWWIQVDERLRGDLPNEDVKKFGELMLPSLKEERYAEGVGKCVDAIIARLEARRGFKLSE